ncbi:hypothetical protein ACNKHQ_17695 [Shigella flexneri]
MRWLAIARHHLHPRLLDNGIDHRFCKLAPKWSLTFITGTYQQYQRQQCYKLRLLNLRKASNCCSSSSSGTRSRY